MVTPAVFGLFIDYKKKKCFIFNNLWDTAHAKSLTFTKAIDVFLRFCISKSIKDRSFFLFAIDRLSKNSRGYHIIMIDLGKNKKVTAVLKLWTQFSPKGLDQIFTWSKKKSFFIALNDGVDQTFGTFFLPVLFPLSCVMY